MTDTVRVPREPTPEMLKAGSSTLDDFWKAQERGPTHVQEAWPGIVQIYAAMLAASPQGEGSSADADTEELRERVRDAMKAWAREDCSTGLKMMLTPKGFCDLETRILDLIQSERGSL